MTLHPARPHSLSRRIMLQLCVFSLVISLLYSVITFMLMYTLEDSFIEKDMLREVDYLTQTYQQTGKWPAARSSNMQLHFSRASFPEDFRELAKQEPRRREFFGQQGRHYHLHHFLDYPDTFLVAEVSGELMVRQIRDGVMQFLAISGILITIIACLIAWLIARKTTQPLKQLAKLVDGVAPEQLPEQFAGQFPNNEVGILARTLEQTLHRTAQALKREKCFTQDVSHELRTPLSVMKNAIELCHSQQTSNTADKLILERIYGAADQMEKTVHTLLMLAREQDARVEDAATDLMPVLEQAILDNRAFLQGKPIDIDVQDNCRVKINAEPNMLKVLLDNILSNAFKYTESGQVNIAFSDNQLLVKDTGPGIEPAIADHITDPGVKGQHSTGFGFGLSIVKRLCEHQGWLMEVNSTQGTTVMVRFP